jgi:hypothetical protein
MATNTDTTILSIEQVKDLIETYPSTFTQLKSIKPTLEALKERYPLAESSTELLYLYINGYDSVPTCECGSTTKWGKMAHGYGECKNKKCSFRNKRIDSKVKRTSIERYGSDCALKTDSIKQKRSKTVQERYGVDHVSKSVQAKQQRKQNLLEKYGVEYIGQIQTAKEKIKKTQWINYYNTYQDLLKFELEDPTNKPEQGDLVKCKSCGMESEFYGAVRYWRCIHCEPIAGSSKFEREILDYIKSIYDGIIVTKDRQILKPKELDIYIPDRNFAIEFNGTYFHSADEESDSDMKSYHLNKTLGCESQGINLMHIWEHEWLDETKKTIYKSMIAQKLGKSKRIHARKTEIRNVPSKESNRFLVENHLQGSCVSKVNLGLYYQGELVALMTFGKPRFNKGYEWELLRFCNKVGYSVVGGAMKLISKFRSVHTGSIISYANREHSSGKLYSAIGFNHVSTSSPSYQWMKGKTVLKRYQTQKHKLQLLLGESFDPSKTESENMFSNGYRRIWDCGNLVYELV